MLASMSLFEKVTINTNKPERHMTDTDYKELLQEVSFKGLSTGVKRTFILAVSIAIFVGLSFTLYKIIRFIPKNEVTEVLTMFILACGCIHYFLTQQLILKQVADFLVCQLPLVKLYDQDKRIVEITKAKIVTLAESIKDTDITIHKRINPQLSSEDSQQVIKHLYDIEDWTVSAENLKKCANFIYQYLLVERWLQQQEMEQSLCPINHEKE